MLLNSHGPGSGNQPPGQEPVRKITGFVTEILTRKNQKQETYAEILIESSELGLDRNARVWRVTANQPMIWPGQEVTIEGIENLVSLTSKPSGQLLVFQYLKRVKVLEIILPTNGEGLEKYLTSFPRVGKTTARRIVARFKTIDQIEAEILSGEKNAIRAMLPKSGWDDFLAAWEDRDPETRRTDAYLMELGLSGNQARKVRKRFGKNTRERISENPYVITRTVPGFGFTRADAIAQKLLIPAEHPFRISAAMSETIHEESAKNGHCYLTRPQLLSSCAKMARVPQNTIAEVLDNHPHDNLEAITVNDEICYTLPRLFAAESMVAKDLTERLNGKKLKLPFDPEKSLRTFNIQSQGKPLNEGQEKAFLGCLTNNVSIVTGGPGTGKTHLLKALTGAYLQAGVQIEKIQLAAPFGRGAVAMTLHTRIPATTIHSLIRIGADDDDNTDPNPPVSYKSSPVQTATLVVLDEVGTCNIKLLAMALRQIPHTARLIMTGDFRQLLPVSEGNPLQDMIESEKIPVFRLTANQRQEKGEGSNILKAANAIWDDHLPYLPKSGDSDLIMIETARDEDIADRIKEIVTNRLPRAYNINPVTDVQVISPQSTTSLGTHALNSMLLEALSDPDVEKAENQVYAVGVKIIQTKNVKENDDNQKIKIANGEIGIVKSYDDMSRETVVEFPHKTITYTPEELRDTRLAYAISLHKLQGSETDYAVIPVTKAHHFMHSQRWFGTAITRGKKKTILVGQASTLYAGLKKQEKRRNTLLSILLSNPSAVSKSPQHQAGQKTK